MKNGMHIIDVHNHISKTNPYIAKCHFQSYEQLIKRMDSNGIDKAVVFPRGRAREDFKSANDYIIEAINNYPDRFIGFCFATPVHHEFAIEEIERCAKAGIRGIKLLPHIHGFYDINGSNMDPIMKKAEELNFTILTHADFNCKRCTPYQVARLAQRFPKVPVIMAHFGMDSDCVRTIPSIVKGIENLYIDTSDTPNMPEAIYVDSVKVIPENVLFGSDTPTLSPEVELYKVEVAQKLFGLTETQKRKILFENAARLFGIKFGD